MRRPGQPEIEVTGCTLSDERAITAEFKKCFAMIGEEASTLEPEPESARG
jgi:hypothetical protein